MKREQFAFERIGMRCYKVIYNTLKGTSWIAPIDDMSLIESTYKTERPAQSSLERLAALVQQTGFQYMPGGVY